MEDAPSEHSGEKEHLAQLEWENTFLLNQAVVIKQTMLKHAEHIPTLERTLRAMCELIEPLRIRDSKYGFLTHQSTDVSLRASSQCMIF